jgi:hypothetical protein
VAHTKATVTDPWRIHVGGAKAGDDDTNSARMWVVDRATTAVRGGAEARYDFSHSTV